MVMVMMMSFTTTTGGRICMGDVGGVLGPLALVFLVDGSSCGDWLGLSLLLGRGTWVWPDIGVVEGRDRLMALFAVLLCLFAVFFYVC